MTVGRFSKIRFGTGLVVTDETSGVIRVDATSVDSGTWVWTTTGPPGTGRVTANNVTDWTLVTQIQIHKNTKAGVDVAVMLMGHTTGEGIRLQDQGNGALWGRYHLTAPPTDSGTYVTYSVAYESSNGVPPANNRDTVVSIESLGGGSGGGGGGITSIGTTTPTSLTGLLKGNGTDVDVAVAGTDYATPAAVALKVDRDAVEAATARLVAVKLAAGDAQPAFRILGDGKHQWGLGGATAPDTNLYRPVGATSYLKTDGSFEAVKDVVVNGGDGGNKIWFSGAFDTNLYRATGGLIKTDGSVEVSKYIAVDGGGTGQKLWFGNAFDTSLYRNGVSILRTDAVFQCAFPGFSARTIEIGAADSGGAGYRMLRVPN